MDLEPKFGPAHLYLGQAYEQKGKHEEAIAEFRKANLSGGSPEALGAPMQSRVIRPQAQNVLRELKQQSRQGFFPPYEIALIYAGLGEKDQAFEWLQKAYEERYPWLGEELKAQPRLDTLRSDPRFRDLVRRIGLPP